MRTKHLLPLLALSACTLMAQPATAKADENSFSLHLEPAMVQPLTYPQDNIYKTGLALGAKGMFALTPNLAIGPSVSSMYLPRSVDDGQNAGTLWQFGGSLRLQGDRRTDGKDQTFDLFGSWSPWLDVDAMFATTGNLYRPAFDVGLGVETALDRTHSAWFGPFLRYGHVVQSADTQSGLLLDGHAVNVLEAGLSFSFDFPPHQTVKTVMLRERIVLHERVKDETPCVPSVVSAPEAFALSEKVYFDRNSSVLRWESRDKLDLVAKQLNAHPNLVIDVQGHASSDGQVDYNYRLSEERTRAVYRYLITHGVSYNRLHQRSFGVGKPAANNATKEGRERNRRVEFVLDFTASHSE